MPTITPAVVLDTETTGFPNNGAGFCGRLIEVGAVVITADARIVSPISFFVKQPRAHLESWQARRAMSVHGIGVHTVLSQGLDAEQAAPRFVAWLSKVQRRFGVEEVRAYNQSFDFWFLERAPWQLFERSGLRPGEDIKDTAKRAMGTRSGPSLKRATAYIREQGCTMTWQSAAHRAQEDARMAAVVALHCERSVG